MDGNLTGEDLLYRRAGHSAVSGGTFDEVGTKNNFFQKLHSIFFNWRNLAGRKCRWGASLEWRTEPCSAAGH